MTHFARQTPEDFLKNAFGVACVEAKRKGLTWTYEGEMIWVKGPNGEIGCNGRRDFIDYVYSYKG